ncbi:DUF7263 family protein [Halobellus sp. GM3]|uniref:DUF7263 family protein n=1 Tax=Halobellus sp. GM3 TaxID=3458410 RepID=UPI00403D58FD
MTARAQANLLGFATAVVVITAVTVAGVALADDALADVDRDPGRAHAAERLAAFLVDGDAPHTRRSNALRSAAVSNLTASDLDEAVPPVRGRPVRVSLGGDVLVDRDGSTDSIGGPAAEAAGGVRSPSDARGQPSAQRAAVTRIERRVRVERAVRRSERVDLSERRRIELDEHVGEVTVTIAPGGAPVRTVRAGGRVVLHDSAGLAGRYAFDPPRTRPLAVEFEPSGSAASGLSRRAAGTATVTWTATNASVERLAVIVGE